MYAWEEPFIERIKRLRNEEVKSLRKAAILQSVSISFSPSITIIAAIFTFFAIT